MLAWVRTVPQERGSDENPRHPDDLLLRLRLQGPQVPVPTDAGHGLAQADRHGDIYAPPLQTEEALSPDRCSAIVYAQAAEIKDLQHKLDVGCPVGSQLFTVGVLVLLFVCFCWREAGNFFGGAH